MEILQNVQNKILFNHFDTDKVDYYLIYCLKFNIKLSKYKIRMVLLIRKSFRN